MFLKAAINGNRNKHDHPAVPLTAEEISNDAKAVVKGGANAIHFHVRNLNGEESLNPDDLNKNLKALRTSLPSTPIGISTGEWIVPDKSERISLIKSWKILPDFVSINFNEDGAEEIAEIMFEKQIGIEAGISNLDDIKIFKESKFNKKCLRILIELEENIPEEGLKTLKEIEDSLDILKITTPRLLHGFNGAAWFFLKESSKRNYQSRIGLEDTLFLPDGRKAKNNEELVKEALKILKLKNIPA